MSRTGSERRWAWDLYPLAARSWPNRQIANDGTLPGQSTEVRRAQGRGQIIYLEPGEPKPSSKMGTFRRKFYLPTDEDLSILKRLYPSADPHQPSWAQIEAELVVAGRNRKDLATLNAPTLTRLLDLCKGGTNDGTAVEHSEFRDERNEGDETTGVQTRAGVTATSAKVGATGDSGKDEAVTKKSWTQPDLDEAIREYKANRAASYRDLVEAVRQGKPGAKKAARKRFGRNAIARALRVRSRTMVSKSPVWGDIAHALGFRGRSSKSGRPREQRIGMGIALEEQAVASSESVVDQVIRRETIAMVEKAMPDTEAEATIEKLQRGDMTDEEARKLMALVAEQKQVERTPKIRQEP